MYGKTVQLSHFVTLQACPSPVLLSPLSCHATPESPEGGSELTHALRDRREGSDLD